MKKFINIQPGLLAILFLLSAIAISCSPEDLGFIPPFSPTVKISSEVDASNPLTVSFTSTTTNAVSYNWEFGDGNTSTEQNPVHTYTSGGTYDVMLTVTGEEGSTPAVATKTVTVNEEVIEKIEGTIIGHPGSWDGINGLTETAFDGDFSTFVDAPGEYASTGFVGYDFGADKAAVLASVKFAARPDWEARMVGGEIRGSNDPTFMEYDVLYTISEEPTSGEFTEAQVSATEGYRFIYYYTAPDGYCNVAELEFYGEL